MVDDPVQDKLLDIIAAQKKGRKRVAKARPTSEEPASNVINIMDALKKSIASERKGRSR
jgi:DNA end-binding protein Ku